MMNRDNRWRAAMGMGILIATGMGWWVPIGLKAAPPATGEQISGGELVARLEQQVAALRGSEMVWRREAFTSANPVLAQSFRQRADDFLDQAGQADFHRAGRGKIAALERQSALWGKWADQQAVDQHSESRWTLRFDDWTSFSGMKRALKDGRPGSGVTFRSKGASDEKGAADDAGQVLLNTLGCCPPLTILHWMRREGARPGFSGHQLETERHEMAVVDAGLGRRIKETVLLKVRPAGQGSRRIEAEFTWPQLVCCRLTVFEGDQVVEWYETRMDEEPLAHAFLPLKVVHYLSGAAGRRAVAQWTLLQTRTVSREGTELGDYERGGGGAEGSQVLIRIGRLPGG